MFKNIKMTVLPFCGATVGSLWHGQIAPLSCWSHKSMISHKAQPNDLSASNQNLIPCPSKCKAKEPLHWSAHPSLAFSLSLFSIQQDSLVFMLFMLCISDQSYSVPHLKSTHLSTLLPLLSQSLYVCGLLSTMWAQPLACAGQGKIHRGRAHLTDQKKRRGHLKTVFPIEQTWPILPFRTFCG